MEAPATCREMDSIPRRRPLHTSLASFISIVTIAYQKAENLNTPLLNKMTNAASLASPLIRASRRLLLTLVSLIDDLIILPVQCAMEAVFPPWKYVFDKIDEMVRMVESLPGNLENAVDKFFVSVLNDCRESVKEKEIVVDENCNEANDESAGIGQGTGQLPAVGSCQGGIKEDLVPLPASKKAVPTGSDSEGSKSETGSPKPSYKEALEKGSRESSPKIVEETIQGNEAEELEGKSKKSHNKDQEILALFESAWLMKTSPPKKGNDDSMTRSASYQW